MNPHLQSKNFIAFTLQNISIEVGLFCFLKFKNVKLNSKENKTISILLLLSTLRRC